VTEYDEFEDHPLAGVPQEVLDVARAVTAEAAQWDCVAVDEADPVADSVVAQLHRAGFITWSRDVPDRETLVLALTQVIYVWNHQLVAYAGSQSLSEWIVDAFVRPLLAGRRQETTDEAEESRQGR